MSNTNTGDKPQITQGEWTKFYQDDDIIIDSEHRSIAIAYITGGTGDKEDEANADLIIAAGNLSQKYGSLEQLESRMIEAEKRVKELEDVLLKLKPIYDGCSTCKNKKYGIESGLWCITNCVSGSRYESQTTINQ